MRTIKINIYQFEELSEKAKNNAIEEVRKTYYENNDFASWAIDDCSLLEPPQEEVENIKGYKFPLIENTRESIYFDTARNNFIDVAKAMHITNKEVFLKWLGIDFETSFTIYTPTHRNADTTIKFEDFDSAKGDVIDAAIEKFNNHCFGILKRIEENIEYRFSDESIKEDIERDEKEFLENGEIYS